MYQKVSCDFCFFKIYMKNSKKNNLYERNDARSFEIYSNSGVRT